MPRLSHEHNILSLSKHRYHISPPLPLLVFILVTLEARNSTQHGKWYTRPTTQHDVETIPATM